ncbi:hypothetical protein [Caballeronia sp. J97]|uniref:hypothetical protein n=1 Tax=Caballeronia sp. J97 TaxID=2805429 RepID=UPI002AB0BE74|nr:hypothetical protein [Caballeronia sp. J97]
MKVEARIPESDGTSSVRERMPMVRRAFARFMRPLECVLCREAPRAPENAWN